MAQSVVRELLPGLVPHTGMVRIPPNWLHLLQPLAIICPKQSPDRRCHAPIFVILVDWVISHNEVQLCP